jgi:uncharacterized membrane protein HdeD (DUF308 family)
MVYMTDTLARNWWALGLRGLCGVLFGAVIFAWPGISLFALVLLFGVYTLLDGVCTMASTLRSDRRDKRWWLFPLQGIGGIIIGIIAFIWPGITALALIYLIGEWLLGLSGIASVVFGALLVAFPGAGALAVLWIIGVYAILFGILLMILAFRLHQRNGHRPHGVRAREA